MSDSGDDASGGGVSFGGLKLIHVIDSYTTTAQGKAIPRHLFRDEATIKAEALREAATSAREEAANSRTPQGRYEAEGMADWLDDRATEIDPVGLEGAHP